MRVIVGCERTQIVTQAFRALGHEAYSIDLLPTEGNPEFHFQMDIRDFSDFSFFDLAIFHPDCTYLAVSGNRTYANSEQRKQAIEFVKWIWTLPVKKLAIENPVGVLSSQFKKPTQYIHPWQYGHGETKKTCIWSRNLPLLIPTNIVFGRENRIWRMGPSKKYNRQHERSRTYPGWANAMAQQWSV
jgi:site-specific DNA-cytosine methylase